MTNSLQSVHLVILTLTVLRPKKKNSQVNSSTSQPLLSIDWKPLTIRVSFTKGLRSPKHSQTDIWPKVTIKTILTKLPPKYPNRQTHQVPVNSSITRITTSTRPSNTLRTSKSLFQPWHRLQNPFYAQSEGTLANPGIHYEAVATTRLALKDTKNHIRVY